MRKLFIDALDDLINDYLKHGEERDEIISALDLKLMALQEEQQEEQPDKGKANLRNTP